MRHRLPGTRRISPWTALALAWLIACAPQPVRLGVLLPLSGEYAVYGEPMRQAMEIACQSVNDAGGIGGRRLELVVRDSGGDPSRAAAEAVALIEEARVPVILAGGTSAEVLAAAPVAQRYGRLLLSPSASTPLLTDAGDWVFRNYPSDALEGKVMADFAAYTLHASKVLVIASENPYSEGLRTEFVRAFEAGGRQAEVLLFRPAEGRVADVAAQAAGRAGQVHALFLVGYAREVAPLVKALRGASLPLRPILAASAVSSSAFLPEAGVAAEGLVFPRPQFDPAAPQPEVSAFANAFRAAAGQEPDIYAAHAYDSVRLVARAMVDQGLSPEDVRRGLKELRNVPGVAGPTTFDPQGDVVRPYQICIVSAGVSVPLTKVRDTALPALQQQVEAARFGRP